MAKLEVNKKVPLFNAPSSEGGSFKLANQKGKYTVIYFYPKDSTPGCTTQAEEFTKLKALFTKNNAQVVGVSRDSLNSHEKFIEKKGLKIPLLSDEDEELCQLFDVLKEKNMYGKLRIGIERSTFLIGPDLKLLREWRKVKAPGHAKEVLEAVKEVQK